MASPIMKESPPAVKVLYDYDYVDEIDHSQVWMKVDEIFDLLNADNDEWWQVCRPNSSDKPFYVPSTYVVRLGDDGHTPLDTASGSPGRDLLHSRGGENVATSNNNNDKGGVENSCGQMDPLDYENVANVNVSSFLKPAPAPDRYPEQIQVQSISRPTDLYVADDDDGYQNLEQYRQEAGISPHTPESPKTPESPESLYANLSTLGADPQLDPTPQRTDNCQYEKTLYDWDVFHDPSSNRLFYVHKETQKTSWKPPKGQFHEELKKKICKMVYVTSVDPDQMWKRTLDREGRSYFYSRHSGVVETKWQLPVANDRERDTARQHRLPNPKRSDKKPSPTTKTPPPLGDRGTGDSATVSPSGGGVEQISALRSGPRLTGAQVSSRFKKSQSVMIENLHFTAPSHQTGQPAPKSATLPPNFNTPIFETPLDGEGKAKSHSDVVQPQFSQSVQLNQPIEGTIQKCKLVAGKNGKKTWTKCYLKLLGSNLVFYKDQKASQPKGSSLHGKYDEMISLMNCQIVKDPRDLTSKKYTFLIMCEDDQYLLQAEDDVKYNEWFLKLHMKIQEMGRNPEEPTRHLTPDQNTASSPKNTRVPSIRHKGHSRMPSDTNSIEKKGRIREALDKFLKKRDSRPNMEKKGIIRYNVFGADLSKLCDNEKTKIPSFVTKVIATIEAKGLEHEGLYRIGGNLSQIQSLRCEVDQNTACLDDPQWDINILAGSLKLFFRELKEPLFTFALYDKFVAALSIRDASERLPAMRAIVQDLPKCHTATMKHLFKHLTNVMERSVENKMSAYALSIVFGPTLLWRQQMEPQHLTTIMATQGRIVEFILLEYKNIFK